MTKNADWESERATGLIRCRVEGLQPSASHRASCAPGFLRVNDCGFWAAQQWRVDLPHPAEYLSRGAKRDLISSPLTELLSFGDVTSRMQELGLASLYKTALGRVSVANTLLARPGWLLQSLQSPSRLSSRQRAAGMSLCLSSPPLFVLCVTAGRFFEGITRLQQEQLQQIPCGFCV